MELVVFSRQGRFASRADVLFSTLPMDSKREVHTSWRISLPMPPTAHFSSTAATHGDRGSRRSAWPPLIAEDARCWNGWDKSATSGPLSRSDGSLFAQARAAQRSRPDPARIVLSLINAQYRRRRWSALNGARRRLRLSSHAACMRSKSRAVSAGNSASPRAT